MTFTDDDLKRFQNRDRSRSAVLMGQEVFAALIARLEAAEMWGACHQEFCDKQDCSAHAAWRKAAGKE